MSGTITDLEESVRSQKIPKEVIPLVMDDALIGRLKNNGLDSFKNSNKLSLSIVGGTAALLSVPMTYLLTFDHVKSTSSVLIRLTLLSPAIFIALTLLVFSISWLMLRWFSLWFIILISGIAFASTLIIGFTSFY